MGKRDVEFTREDWQKVVDECNRQFELMEKTKKEMAFAYVCQMHLLEFAKEKLKDFPSETKV